jgi:hypothetical protein
MKKQLSIYLIARAWRTYLAGSTSVTKMPFSSFPNVAKSQTLNSQTVKLCSYNCLVRRIYLTTIAGCVLIHIKLAVVTQDGSVGDPITEDVDPRYNHCFLKAETKGVFTEEDVGLNGILDADNLGAPKFVKDYEELLSRKRKVASRVRCLNILCYQFLTNVVSYARKPKRGSSLMQFWTNISARRRSPHPLTLSTDLRLSTSCRSCPSIHETGEPSI